MNLKYLINVVSFKRNFRIILLPLLLMNAACTTNGYTEPSESYEDENTSINQSDDDENMWAKNPVIIKDNDEIDLIADTIFLPRMSNDTVQNKQFKVQVYAGEKVLIALTKGRAVSARNYIKCKQLELHVEFEEGMFKLVSASMSFTEALIFKEIAIKECQIDDAFIKNSMMN